MSDATQATTHTFQAEVSEVLNLVIHSLYSHREIFLRELISNASDALDKLRFRGITEPALVAGHEPQIKLLADADANTLSIVDNGVGMTHDELVEHLGTIAKSGSKAFAASLAEAKTEGGDLNLIGQFGVGFYSAWLVAERVDVISRAAGSDEAFTWSSDAKQSFTVEPAEREQAGTTVVLHLRDDQKEFTQPWRLRHLVERYSDYVSYPVMMPVERYDDDDTDTTDDAPEFERVNQASALWRRPTEELDDEACTELYKHLAHDWEPPLARTHFRIEGGQQFFGLLFVPSRPPFDLYDRDKQHGVRLYVRRVFIMDDAEELVPTWLRFLRGVIDSDDLPLNVSRELLQDSRITRTIRKQVVRKTLDLLESMAADRPDDYATFWTHFGRVLKEGLHFDREYTERLAKLTRWQSSNGDGMTSLEEYVARMPDEQPAIYYAQAASRKLLEGSPHLEALRKRGWEVLYMTDGIDAWAVQALTEFDGKPLVSALGDELDLDGESETKDDENVDATELGDLQARFTTVLGEKVAEVRPSRRLAESPVCLVIPKGGMAAHIERALRAQDVDMPEQKRILELNPEHPVIVNLQRLATAGDEAQVTEWIEMLYDQALLSEGSPIDDPARFATRMTALLQRATTDAVSGLDA